MFFFFFSSPDSSKKSSLASTSSGVTRSSLSSERNRISQLLWSPSPEPQPTLDKTATLLLSSGISTPTLAGQKDEPSTREEFEKDEYDSPPAPTPLDLAASGAATPDLVTEPLVSDFPGEDEIPSTPDGDEKTASFGNHRNPLSPSPLRESRPSSAESHARSHGDHKSEEVALAGNEVIRDSASEETGMNLAEFGPLESKENTFGTENFEANEPRLTMLPPTSPGRRLSPTRKKSYTIAKSAANASNLPNAAETTKPETKDKGTVTTKFSNFARKFDLSGRRSKSSARQSSSSSFTSSTSTSSSGRSSAMDNKPEVEQNASRIVHRGRSRCKSAKVRSASTQGKRKQSPSSERPGSALADLKIDLDEKLL